MAVYCHLFVRLLNHVYKSLYFATNCAVRVPAITVVIRYLTAGNPVTRKKVRRCGTLGHANVCKFSNTGQTFSLLNDKRTLIHHLSLANTSFKKLFQQSQWS